MASPRTAKTIFNIRPARVAPTATQRCSWPFGLVLQKNVTSEQYILRFEATDSVVRKVSFILLVPVELKGFLHLQQCTLIVHTLEKNNGNRCIKVIYKHEVFLALPLWGYAYDQLALPRTVQFDQHDPLPGAEHYLAALER